MKSVWREELYFQKEGKYSEFSCNVVTLLPVRMKLPNNRQCGMDGDGKKVDQAPPFRNPFVHVLKFTPLEKAKVNSRF